MKKIEFINDSAPYLSAENLNLLQDNVEESIDEINKVIVSSTEPTTGEEVWLQKGKNYINLEELTNYSLNETTGALEINNTRLVTPYIFLKAGTYTISCNVSRFAYVIYNKDKSFNSFVSWQTFPNKIILNSDCYIRVEIIKDYNGSEVINKTDIIYLQLEKGEVATSYEPYTPKKIHTKTDNGYEEFYNEENKEVYSIGETRIGTWIDGKPLYRKQFIINFTGNNGWQNFELGISNIDFLTKEWDICILPSSDYGQVNESIESNGGRIQLLPSINAVALYTPFADIVTEYISILYTKTTD